MEFRTLSVGDVLKTDYHGIWEIPALCEDQATILQTETGSLLTMHHCFPGAVLGTEAAMYQNFGVCAKNSLGRPQAFATYNFELIDEEWWMRIVKMPFISRFQRFPEADAGEIKQALLRAVIFIAATYGLRGINVTAAAGLSRRAKHGLSTEHFEDEIDQLALKYGFTYQAHDARKTLQLAAADFPDYLTTI